MTSVTANTKICSAHFKEEDYDEEDARMVSLGLKTERLAKLIPTTEPSAQHLSACRYHTERHQESRDATTDDEDDPSVISDSSWVPGGHMSEDEEELCEEEPSHTCDPHQNGIDKFIVCQEVLMSLFALCPACCEKSDSLCIMWLPTFLAKPANAPQEHGVSYFGSHNSRLKRDMEEKAMFQQTVHFGSISFLRRSAVPLGRMRTAPRTTESAYDREEQWSGGEMIITRNQTC
ncbi:hypothetical protein N1851_025919 [Merluccius polli]|uniref:THAP-type domain-containing protein n=1 Tax=Merluccius polli TaxID=89951 RepID=A0AA47MCS6_MERPO|nr:hypothetical protein N1851_025919 [Merluccius polli]